MDANRTCSIPPVGNGVDEAIKHIDLHGGNHTASIVTNNSESTARFTRYIDASCVMVNVSTRFNDGGELELEAEMGISPPTFMRMDL